MKKWQIALIVTGVVLALAGIAVVVLLIIGATGVLQESKRYGVEETITELSVDVGAPQFTLEEGEAFSVESNLKYLEVSTQNGKLTVEQTNKVGIYTSKAFLKITVPTGFEFEKVGLEIDGGKTEIESLVTRELEMDVGGEFTVQSLVVTYSGEVDCSGNMKICSGELTNVEFEVGIGSLELVATLSGETTIDLGLGSVDVRLTGGKSRYQLALGRLDIGKIEVEGVERKIIMMGNGKNRLTLDGSFGSIKVNYAD